MSKNYIELNQVGICFRKSWDKAWTLRSRLARTLLERKTPKSRAYFKALSDVTFRIDKGERVGIIGPNGCGKTTLLRTISGIFVPDEGEVRTSGRIAPLLSLGTGFDLNLSGHDNLRLNGLTLGMTLEEIERKADAIIQFAGLGKFMDTPMRYYSTGMIGRLGFAISLAREAEILLIDEVFSVGDLDFQNRSREALDNLMQKVAIQVIVSHNLDTVTEFCDRVIYMRGGCVVADGPTPEVLEKYRADTEAAAGAV